MHRPCRSHTVVSLLALSLFACSRAPQTDARPPSESAAAVESAAPLESAAASESPAPTGHPVEGSWDLQPTHPRSADGPGLRMTLAIDSVRNERIHGRVTWYSAGDMPGSPNRFRPLSGETMGDSAIHMHTALIDEGAPTFHFVGSVHGDTISLELFAIGTDTLSREEREWRLVRERR